MMITTRMPQKHNTVQAHKQHKNSERKGTENNSETKSQIRTFEAITILFDFWHQHLGNIESGMERNL